MKRYGQPPFNIAVVHGGPGAPGEMQPVASALSKTHGVLEPWQTRLTVEGEIEELRLALEENAALPATLVGYSWGAWLVFMLAARYPSLVAKLILVGCPPFTQEYAFAIDQTRFSRLKTAERQSLQILKARLDNPDYRGDKNALMARLGNLFSRADYFDPLPHRNDAECRWDIFSRIWPQALEMRRSGALLSMAQDIECPVVAIHGDYDPHPAEGVKAPLGNSLKGLRFILLPHCGHVPWFEKQAREAFYAALLRELA